jgi:hypothetical protein
LVLGLGGCLVYVLLLVLLLLLLLLSFCFFNLLDQRLLASLRSIRMRPRHRPSHIPWTTPNIHAPLRLALLLQGNLIHRHAQPSCPLTQKMILGLLRIRIKLLKGIIILRYVLVFSRTRIHLEQIAVFDAIYLTRIDNHLATHHLIILLKRRHPTLRTHRLLKFE